MLENVQLIKEKEEIKFAVIPFIEFQEIKALLTNPDKLADYLDYLHVQRVKAQNPTRLSLLQVKAALAETE